MRRINRISIPLLSLTGIEHGCSSPWGGGTAIPLLLAKAKSVSGHTHTFYRQTSDSGVKTWSEPVGFPRTFFCRSNGIKLISGELLLPVYTVKENGDEDKDLAASAPRTEAGSWKLGEGISSPPAAPMSPQLLKYPADGY